MLDLAAIRAVSFDCYGTLIDWQSGILAAVKPVLPRHGVTFTDEQIIERFASAEREAEKPPYISYKDVQRRVMSALIATSDIPHPTSDVDCLWQFIPSWPAFPDTAPSLRALGERWKLAVVSNIDDDLFAATRPKLEAAGARLEVVVTAEQVRSYKPGRAHFDELLARLDLKPAEVLHVAESRWHDVEPARVLGFRTVWVTRAASSSGAVPSASGPGAAEADLAVASMTALVDAVNAA